MEIEEDLDRLEDLSVDMMKLHISDAKSEFLLRGFSSKYPPRRVGGASRRGAVCATDDGASSCGRRLPSLSRENS